MPGKALEAAAVFGKELAQVAVPQGVGVGRQGLPGGEATRLINQTISPSSKGG